MANRDGAEWCGVHAVNAALSAMRLDEAEDDPSVEDEEHMANQEPPAHLIDEDPALEDESTKPSPAILDDVAGMLMDGSLSVPILRLETGGYDTATLQGLVARATVQQPDVSGKLDSDAKMRNFLICAFDLVTAGEANCHMYVPHRAGDEDEDGAGAEDDVEDEELEDEGCELVD